ncbi:MAG: TrbC/VirB2 family protein [Pseudomonadota bacterium]
MQFAIASSSLADPIGTSPLVAATLWLQGTLLGTLATTIAVVAVAWVGLMMLSGRVDLRRGATVVLGCFILFGASSIAAGIRASVNGGEAMDSPARDRPGQSPPIVVPSRAATRYDPYAGASVQPR